MENKRIHIIGIAGVMTSAIALELKKRGCRVSGSDQDKIYPPMSQLVEEFDINKPVCWNNIDMVVVGSAYKNIARTREEYELVKAKNIPHLSATKFLASLFLEKECIIVAGSYGKTTISGALAHLLDSSYYVGGQIVGKLENLSINSSRWAVIEGDESINGMDTRAKFLEYPINHLILTSVDWEHKDCYKSEEEVLDAYRSLINKVPDSGFVVINRNIKNWQKLTEKSKGKVIAYGQESWKTPLLGDFNQENLTAAAVMAKNLGIESRLITEKISEYKGIRRRLEVLGQKKGAYWIDDFGQSPKRIEKAIEAIIESFGEKSIYVFFEPHASFLRQKLGLIGLGKAFSKVNKIILGKIIFDAKVDKNQRVSAKDFVDEIGDKLIYCPTTQMVENEIVSGTPSVIVHFSSGGLEGMKLFRKIFKNYKLRK